MCGREAGGEDIEEDGGEDEEIWREGCRGRWRGGWWEAGREAGGEDIEEDGYRGGKGGCREDGKKDGGEDGGEDGGKDVGEDRGEAEGEDGSMILEMR